MVSSKSFTSTFIQVSQNLTNHYPQIQAFVTPFHRLFSLSDLHIHYPHAIVERVPVSYLFVYALGIPLLCLAIWSSLFRPAVHKIHVTYLGLLISVFLTVFLTDFIKNGVGRPRPDLLDRCKPKAGTEKVDLVDWHVCTQTDSHVLHDGFRSFPSGHSSFSFAGLGFLSLYVFLSPPALLIARLYEQLLTDLQHSFFASQTHTLHPHASLPSLLLTIAPLLGALTIAISRCEDYRHDVWDVTAGSILGLVVAWLTYRRYYPNLRDRHCETPYPSPGEVMRRRLGSAKIDEESQRRRRRDSEGSEPEEEEIRRDLLGRPSETNGER